MHLKELKISGFKSFAKKSELLYDRPITAVVGPNGSGKSNVAEALRFVLGEQSPSKMRGKKGEDLIWSGSRDMARANRASVAITLDNTAKIFPLDFPEIIVERTVYRDGTNEYQINGSRVRLKDVQELLAAAHIGASGHHIISQGEADRVLLARPRERRAMLEDALGLNVYHFKIEESERKLTKAEANMREAELVRRELGPQLASLARRVKKGEKAVALREELTVAYTEYLWREERYLTETTARLSAETKTLADDDAAVAAALEAARRQLTELGESDVEREIRGLKEELTKEEAARRNLMRQVGQHEGQIELLERRVKGRVGKKKSHASKPLPRGDVAAIARGLDRALAEAVRSNDHAAIRRAAAAALMALRNLLTKTDDVGVSPATDDTAELRTLQERRSAVEAELEEATKRETALREKIVQCERAVAAAASDRLDVERHIAALESDGRELSHRRETLDHAHKELGFGREQFEEELREAAVLIGSAVRGYRDYTPPRSDGGAEANEEPRAEQEARRRALEKMKIRLEELGVGVDSETAKEYEDMKTRDEFLAGEIADLERSAAQLRQLIVDLESELHGRFTEGLQKINSEFERLFTIMFGGGSARLTLISPQPRAQADADAEMSDDATESRAAHSHAEQTQIGAEADDDSGIEIDVSLPNKRVKGLQMLSGGERALTSIALIFAMSQINPPLFIILDETDAALDEANSRRYGDMIEELAKKSQLILITHNRETMSRAGVLYGVTMGGDGISRLLSVKFDEAVQVAK